MAVAATMKIPCKAIQIHPLYWRTEPCEKASCLSYSDTDQQGRVPSQGQHPVPARRHGLFRRGHDGTPYKRVGGR